MRKILLAGAALLLSGAARAAEIHVVSSGGFAAAYTALAPEYERASGDHLSIVWGPSMGATPDTVPSRLARGEALDVVVMVGSALDQLVQQGRLLGDSRTELAKSLIGAAVKHGAPHPDIATVEGLKQALLAAKSIAYSDSASGVYISSKLYQRLGIADQVAAKSRMIPADPVGGVVAKGEAELGFQQVAELKPVAGIDLLGPIPQEVQLVTLYVAAVPVASHDVAAARRFIAFLASPQAAPTIAATGLEPLAGK